MDDEDEAFEWVGVNVLHAYAWKAQQGSFLPWVSQSWGVAIIEALKEHHLDDEAVVLVESPLIYTVCCKAAPFINAISDAVDLKRSPKWD